MRIRDTERVSRAIQLLKGGRSLDALVDRIYDITEGSLALDRATLHRIAVGRTQVARALDTPEDCIRLYFALMIVGAESGMPAASVAEEGHAILTGFVGEPLAGLIFRDLSGTIPKLQDRRALKEYLEEGLRIWLPK